MARPKNIAKDSPVDNTENSIENTELNTNNSDVVEDIEQQKTEVKEDITTKSEEPFKITKIARESKIKIEDDYVFDLISGRSGVTGYTNGKEIDYKWYGQNEAHKVTYKDFLFIKSQKPKMFSTCKLLVEDENVHINHEDIKEYCYSYYKVIDLSWVNKGIDTNKVVSNIPRSLITMFLDNLKKEVKENRINNFAALGKICKLLNVKLEELQD